MSKYIILTEKYRMQYYQWDSRLCAELKPIFIPNNPNIDFRLSGHTDLSIFQFDNTNILCANYLKNDKNIEFLSEIGVNIIIDDTQQGSTCPLDCALNCITLGNTLVCNPKSVSHNILDYYTDKNYMIAAVKQSYVKCSVCKVSDNALITSDPGILKTLKKTGFDTLYVEPENINLEGFSSGFIGGASFLNDNTIYFTGRFCDKTAAQIEAFAAKYIIDVVYLTDHKPEDIGSCIIV